MRGFFYGTYTGHNLQYRGVFWDITRQSIYKKKRYFNKLYLRCQASGAVGQAFESPQTHQLPVRFLGIDKNHFFIGTQLVGHK